MTEDYEELPCPETNTFQVGDLVRVYYAQVKWSGPVHKVNGEYVQIKDTQFETTNWHFKQCRPLKKKEPPKPWEFWIRTWNNYPSEEFEAFRSKPQLSGKVFRTLDCCPKCGEDFNK